MKIAIVAPSPVPFVIGGAERLAHGLMDAINELTTHDAELIKIPSAERSLPELIRGYRQFSELNLDHFDAIISSKYPAWMVQHPNHIIYMMHPLRGLYDTYHLFGQPEEPDSKEPVIADLVATLRHPGSSPEEMLDATTSALASVGPNHSAFAFPGPIARLLIRALDDHALDAARVVRHAAISATVAARPGYFPRSVTVHSVIPPTSLTGFRCEAFDHFFTASRLDDPKRVELIIEAMRYVPTGTKLRIAGDGPARLRLEALAGDNPDIEFLGFVSDETLVTEYANALAVPFVPLNEDLGLITLEAQLSGKPVVTCDDSGGPTELVDDGVSGYIVAPTAEEIGATLAALAKSPDQARTLGANGRRSAQFVTWQRVLAQILPPEALLRQRRDQASLVQRDQSSARPPPVRKRAARPSIVALSTYPIFPSHHGGQLRCAHLYGALANKYDVELICLDGAGDRWADGLVRPGVTQTVVPRSERHRELEAKAGALVAGMIPLTDICAALYGLESADFVATVASAARRAKLVLLAHPYLQPVASDVAGHVPMLYDAHNAEYLLKSELLPQTRGGDELRRVVREVEARAVKGARAITYCSAEDQRALAQLAPTMADWVFLPNGTDVQSIPFVTAPVRQLRRDKWLHRMRCHDRSSRAARIAIFVGSYHPPNNDAAVHILNLAPQFPDVLFILVGSHCEYLKDWILPSNALLAGVLPDRQLRELLAIADVALNPMTRGSGTNLKLIEAFAAGAPVVATPVGSRGIDTGGKDIMVVADLDQFSTAMAATLDDIEGATARAHVARHVVEERYDWAVLGARLQAEVDELLLSG